MKHLQALNYSLNKNWLQKVLASLCQVLDDSLSLKATSSLFETSLRVSSFGRKLLKGIDYRAIKGIISHDNERIDF